MALQSDAGIWDMTAETLLSRPWHDTFDSAPVNAIIFGVVDKKKSMIYKGNTTTQGCSAATEDTQVRFLALEPGYSESGSHPEMDSGTLQVTTTKVLEAVSFNDTFSAVPIVITGYYGTDSDDKGGKTSAANRTTTGCDVTTEIKETGDNCNWVAVYTNGFFDQT